jgi:hypothetical protein
MAQSDTIRYEPKLADIAIIRICLQGVAATGRHHAGRPSNRTDRPSCPALRLTLGLNWSTDRSLASSTNGIISRHVGADLCGENPVL